MLTVVDMAFNNVDKYAHYLELTHAPIVTFGGAFLLMLFLDYLKYSIPAFFTPILYSSLSISDNL